MAYVFSQLRYLVVVSGHSLSPFAVIWTVWRAQHVAMCMALITFALYIAPLIFRPYFVNTIFPGTPMCQFSRWSAFISTAQGTFVLASEHPTGKRWWNLAYSVVYIDSLVSSCNDVTAVWLYAIDIAMKLLLFTQKICFGFKLNYLSCLY